MMPIYCNIVKDHILDGITQGNESQEIVGLRRNENQNRLAAFLAEKHITSYCSGDGTRVPSELQKIFVSASQGHEVHVPPPKGLATKTFKRSRWTSRLRNSFKSISNNFRFNERKEERHSVTINDVDSSQNSMKNPISKKIKKSSSRKSLYSKPKPKCHEIVPQQFLLEILQERGYSVNRYNSLESAYFNKPTAYQMICYGSHIVEIIQSGNISELEALLSSGMSPNACNAHGQSIVHMVCRLGNFEMLQILLDYGCSIQTADDHGRSPLHDICLASNPSFDVVTMCLEIDSHMLFVQDSRGHVPLDYVQPCVRSKWIQYFEQNMNILWPKRLKIQGEEVSPPITCLPPNSMQLKDPFNALPSKVAQMLAEGRITIDDAEVLRPFVRQNNCIDLSIVDEDEDSTSDSDTDSDTNSLFGSEFSSSTGSLFDVFSEHELHLFQIVTNHCHIQSAVDRETRAVFQSAAVS